MVADEESTVREDAQRSLERMQSFDPGTLPREDELGSSFQFRAAVGPARKLVELYQRLSVSALDDFPLQHIQQVLSLASRNLQQLDEILSFDPKQVEATTAHERQVQALRDAYQPAFAALHPLISYSLHKTADFRRLEEEVRTTLQTLRDEGHEITEALKQDKKAATDILEDVRKLAAETGVSQQAFYFRQSADSHEQAAGTWLQRTVNMAIALGVYAVASLFLHKVPWLTPGDPYQTIQLAVSKVLIFAVLSYVLYLCARNMLSHRHNAIVDRHRQNALMTYKALVEAAGDTPNREVILVQAAACIFAPQGTGYSSDSTPRPPGAHSVVEFMTKPLQGGE